MDTSSPTEEPLPQAPRWLQVVAGVVIAPLSLLCLAGSVALVASPAAKSPILGAATGGVFILISAWLLIVAVRLIANRPHRGGLMGPPALRVCAVLFIGLPIVGLFTGYYQQRGLTAVAQAGSYVLVALVLFGLAKRRSQAA